MDIHATAQQPAPLTLDQALHQAIADHQAGRLQDAERLYRAILQAQPNHPDANHNLGALAVQVKQPAAGLPYFRAALEANPNQGQYWLSYIDALIQAGQADAARQVLEQGRQLGLGGEAVETLAVRLAQLENPAPGQAAEIGCAIAHREAGRYKEAALALQGWLAGNPQDASAHALLSQVLSLDKRDEAAWAALNIALSINPALPDVQRNHARLLLKKQKPGEALHAAQAACRADAADPENLLVLAAALGANNQDEQALQLATAALQNRPNYAEAFANRALLKLRNGDPAGALADAEKCLAIKPHLAQLWGMVGLLRHQFKNLPGAIDALEKALDSEPDNAGHLVNLGEFKRQAGAVDAAIALLEKAVSIAPGNADAWVNLGAALQQAKRMPKAKAAYAKALEIAPGQAEVASNLGVLAKEEENWEEALRYFGQALEHQPARVAIITNKAAVLNALERYAEAEQTARHAIEIDPAHTEAHLALSGALMGQRRYEDAQAVLNTLTQPASTDVEGVYQMALSYANLFRAQECWTVAESWIRKALVAKPNEVKMLRHLGAILSVQKRYKDACTVLQEALKNSPEDADALQAMISYHALQECWTEAENWARRALEVKPKEVKALRQLGAILDEQMRHEDAWAVLQEALEQDTEDADTMQSLASHLARQERWAEAESWARRTLEMKPKEVKALRQLGAILDEQMRHEDAWTVLQEALELDTEDADTMQSIASHLARQERWADAESWERRALEVKPDYVKALNGLASCLLAQDNSLSGLNTIVRSLQIEESTEAKSIFVECMKPLQFRQGNDYIREAMVRALSEPWDRPSKLALMSTNLVKLDPDIGGGVTRAAKAWPVRLSAQDLFGENGFTAVATDPLLRALLNSAPISNIEMERFLTMARCAMLESATGMSASEGEGGTTLNFYCALACQCFINEYVFSHTDDEIRKAGDLRDSLATALEANAQVPNLWPVAVAAYFPLCSLPLAARLLERQWPGEVEAVLKQQVCEPVEEQQLRATIPRLTGIENEVSLLVQNQYEENPYPRWIKIARNDKPMAVVVALRRMFPLAEIRPIDKWHSPDILCAGCGTGQQPIGTAMLFRGARVLAVDLSMASLCYAKRKTRDMGLTSIEYAQADLLELDSLGRSFDVIESAGVLHHLADPWAGWRVLLSLLRPGGFMKLGFYSEVARRNVVRARGFISEQGYGTKANEIRQCRQYLLGLDKSADFGTTLKSSDFFSISTCRDLLFHVQEHRMTLTGIDAFLRENNLAFLGFEIDASVLRAYKLRFPDDRAAINLAQWQIYENENPDTFIGMYQFWIQKVEQAGHQYCPTSAGIGTATRVAGKTTDAMAARLEVGVQVAAQSKAEHQHAFKESQPVSPAVPYREKSPSPQEMNRLVALFTGGQYTEALNLAQVMTERFPLHGFGWKVLGVVYKQMGRSAEALASMQKAVALSPVDAEAHCNLGIVLGDLGRFDEAEAGYRRALEIRPDYPEAHSNLGLVLKGMGRTEEAEDSYRRALRARPDLAEAHSNLGNTLRDLGRLGEAEGSLRRALEIRPDYAMAHSNLGCTLHDLGRLGEAEASFRRALQIEPGLAEAHSNLGNTLRDLSRLDEAEASLRRALEAKPDFAEAHSNLGNTLRDLGRLDEAEANCRRALQIKPDYAEAHGNLGATLTDLGRLDEAEASYRRALQLKPDYAEVHSNLLFLHNYTSSHAPSYCLAEARQFGQKAGNKIQSRFAAWPCARQPERLRVGLVSGDLRNHPVGYFLESLLNKLDRASVELIAYPTVHRADELTARIRPRFAAWKPLIGQSDEAAARLVHSDGVHVLMDISGHTRDNRLSMFAWKPAPVQVSWLGYFATTGMPEIDYLLGDRHVAPGDEASHFTEKIWHLPESYLCFTEPGVALEVAPLPALSAGGITFGCFNNLTKMNDAVVAVWARILAAVPGSRLFLKTMLLNEAPMRGDVLQRFARHGIAADRLILEGASPRAELLASYHRVDIALDPFPYPGGTTSVEGLWLGVPVVTKRGDRFLSHVGETIAHNAGLPDWIAADEDDYVAKAAAYASDLDRLAKLRAGLRQQVLASPLFDAARFARHFEDALWGMWGRWLQQKGES